MCSKCQCAAKQPLTKNRRVQYFRLTLRADVRRVGAVPVLLPARAAGVPSKYLPRLRHPPRPRPAGQDGLHPLHDLRWESGINSVSSECLCADNYDPPGAVRRCAREVTVDLPAIEACAAGDEGNLLHKLAGDLTHSLQPRVTALLSLQCTAGSELLHKCF